MPEKMAEQNQAEIPFSTTPVVHIAGTRVGIRVLNSGNSLAAVPLAPRVLQATNRAQSVQVPTVQSA